MRTSIVILASCCLLSCSLFKNSSLSKTEEKSYIKATTKTQELKAEKRSALATETFFSNDSSETISMVEVSPIGAVSFNDATGLSVTASRLRIFTKTRTGRASVGKIIEQVEASAETKTNSKTTTAQKITSASKTKVEKPAYAWGILILLVSTAIIFCTVKYLRIIPILSIK